MDAVKRKLLFNKEVDAILVDAVSVVNPDDIEKDLMEVAPYLAYFNEIHSDALASEKQAEMELKETSARLIRQHRDSLTAEARETKEKFKPPTVDAVEAAVHADPEYLQALENLNNCEVVTVRARGRAEAVKAKKDAIIQIASNRRAEMAIDPARAAEFKAMGEARRARAVTDEMAKESRR